MKKSLLVTSFLLAISLLIPTSSVAQASERARDRGVPFDGTPGTLNTITDRKGVEVGGVTLVSGKGLLKVGVGPVRTGVTTVFPRGKANPDPVY